MRPKTVITKLLQSVKEVYYKMRQVLQSVTELYYKVRQVLQSVTDCYYKVRQVLQSVTGCYYKVRRVLQSNKFPRHKNMKKKMKKVVLSLRQQIHLQMILNQITHAIPLHSFPSSNFLSYYAMSSFPNTLIVKLRVIKDH